MTKRYTEVGGIYLNIFGDKINYRGQDGVFNVTPHGYITPGTRHTHATCEAACTIRYAYELHAMTLREEYSILIIRGIMGQRPGVLPCCHGPSLCNNCRRSCTTDHLKFKCIYGPGRLTAYLSHMDVYCPGWKDRWIGPAD